MTQPAPPVDDLWRLELAKARQDAGQGAPEAAPGGYWLAAAIGLLGLAKTLLTPGGGRLPPGAPLLAVVHREDTNRTRHVVDRLAAEAPGTPVLLVGRPHEPLSVTRSLFASRGLVDAPLVRPYDLGAALAATPAILRRLAEGASAFGQAAWLPPRSKQAAIVFRVALGEVKAAWIRARRADRSLVARGVILGHTGVADVHLLERALQQAGARTLHWVHGRSEGLNMHGGSDVGLFQCLSDARWHEALGGYGEVAALPAEAPVHRAGGRGWVVLSNLVHPMTPAYRERGIEPEVELLARIAEAADKAGLARRDILWKPHPIIDGMLAHEKPALLERAQALGVTPWPHPAQAGLAPAGDAAMVVVTPSTTAVDVLKMGRVPVLFDPPASDPMDLMSQFPLQARDADGLLAALARIDDAALFAETWSRVGPGRPVRMADILALLARR